MLPIFYVSNISLELTFSVVNTDVSVKSKYLFCSVSLGKTHERGWWGGQLCRDICLCTWGAKNRQAFL